MYQSYSLATSCCISEVLNQTATALWTLEGTHGSSSFLCFFGPALQLVHPLAAWPLAPKQWSHGCMASSVFPKSLLRLKALLLSFGAFRCLNQCLERLRRLMSSLRACESSILELIDVIQLRDVMKAPCWLIEILRTKKQSCKIFKRPSSAKQRLHIQALLCSPFTEHFRFVAGNTASVSHTSLSPIESGFWVWSTLSGPIPSFTRQFYSTSSPSPCLKNVVHEDYSRRIGFSIIKLTQNSAVQVAQPIYEAPCPRWNQHQTAP